MHHVKGTKKIKKQKTLGLEAFHMFSKTNEKGRYSYEHQMITGFQMRHGCDLPFGDRLYALFFLPFFFFFFLFFTNNLTVDFPRQFIRKEGFSA